MRSRRVVLNNNPNCDSRPSTGTDRGKTASMPVYNPQSWRNPGGPIGPPTSHQTTGYATAKPNHAEKHPSANGRAGRNVQRQHPYAGNKHSKKATSKGRQQNKRHSVNSSAYSGPVYRTPLSRSLPNSVPTTDKATQTKPKRTLAARFCGYPSKEEDQV